MSDAAVPEQESASWYLYLIRCCRGTLYTGITTDVQRRFAEHQEGGMKSARYLRGKAPLELVFSVVAGDRGQAATLEYRVKRLSRATKLALIDGRLDIHAAVATQLPEQTSMTTGQD